MAHTIKYEPNPDQWSYKCHECGEPAKYNFPDRRTNYCETHTPIKAYETGK